MTRNRVRFSLFNGHKRSAGRSRVETGRTLAAHTFFGALFGMLLLHPLTMAVYWSEYNSTQLDVRAFFSNVFERMFMSFDPVMWTMASAFILFGTFVGLGSGLYSLALRRKERQLTVREFELERTAESLLSSAENERLEFKSSLRWDWNKGSVNKLLENPTLKTIAGFMNNRGGVLVLGVSDEGTVLGLEKDYSTLKQQTRDGFHQHIMHLVSARLGAELCSLLSVRFQCTEDKDVCIVLVSAANQPVYLNSGDQVMYYLRTGNSTRELNTREAVSHIQERF